MINILPGPTLEFLGYEVPVAMLMACAAVIVVMLWWTFLLCSRDRPKDDPKRIAGFLQSMSGLEWSVDTYAGSLENIYTATIRFFQGEVAYHHASRLRYARIINISRAGTFGFGLAGVMCPLVSATRDDCAGLAQIGYLCLAVAAAFFLGNELFGGTRGYARAIATQYKLEALLQIFVLRWQEWRAWDDGSQNFNHGFELLHGLLEHSYRALSDGSMDARPGGDIVTHAFALRR